MNYIAILFIWMKYFYIIKNDNLYKNNQISKYIWLFYISRLLYPIWIFFGLFFGKSLFLVIFLLELLKFIIYPIVKPKIYKK